MMRSAKPLSKADVYYTLNSIFTQQKVNNYKRGCTQHELQARDVITQVLIAQFLL